MATVTEGEAMTSAGFQEVKAALAGQLTSRLEAEAIMDEFEADGAEGSDIFDTPAVDSKSVIKLSPIVEDATGKKIRPEWIKPGGYGTVEEAVSDLIRQLELDFEKGEVQDG